MARNDFTLASFGLRFAFALVLVFLTYNPTGFSWVGWLFIEWGLVALDDTATIQWVLLFVLTGVLAVGMSWSHIRRKLSGQYDTDEIEG